MQKAPSPAPTRKNFDWWGGRAAGVPLYGTGEAVDENRECSGVSGFAGVRGAARPRTGVKGQSAPCRRRHPRVPWKVPCATGPLAAGGILSALKGWGVKGVP